MLASDLVGSLRDAGATVALAESLTGGLVSAALTEVAGASEVVRGGVVAYGSDLKVSVLGVDVALLERHGAVHPEVAEQMALGVRRLMEARYGIATTGVAGPTEQNGQPVGTVFVGLSCAAGEQVRALHLDGDRAAIRRQSTHAALELLRDELAGRPDG